MRTPHYQQAERSSHNDFGTTGGSSEFTTSPVRDVDRYPYSSYNPEPPISSSPPEAFVVLDDIPNFEHRPHDEDSDNRRHLDQQHENRRQEETRNGSHHDGDTSEEENEQQQLREHPLDNDDSFDREYLEAMIEEEIHAMQHFRQFESFPNRHLAYSRNSAGNASTLRHSRHDDQRDRENFFGQTGNDHSGSNNRQLYPGDHLLRPRRDRHSYEDESERQNATAYGGTAIQRGGTTGGRGGGTTGGRGGGTSRGAYNAGPWFNTFGHQRDQHSENYVRGSVTQENQQMGFVNAGSTPQQLPLFNPNLRGQQRASEEMWAGYRPVCGPFGINRDLHERWFYLGIVPGPEAVCVERVPMYGASRLFTDGRPHACEFEGVVMAVGGNRHDRNGVSRYARYRVGDRVILPRTRGIPYTQDGDEFEIFYEHEILGKFHL